MLVIFLLFVWFDLSVLLFLGFVFISTKLFSCWLFVSFRPFVFICFLALVAITDVSSNATPPVASKILKGTFVIGEARQFVANQKPETIPECSEETTTNIFMDVNKSDETEHQSNLEAFDQNSSEKPELHQKMLEDMEKEVENPQDKDLDESNDTESNVVPLKYLEENEEPTQTTNTEKNCEETDVQMVAVQSKKPDIRFPKPVLLPKPDLPEEYFG